MNILHKFGLLAAALVGVIMSAQASAVAEDVRSEHAGIEDPVRAALMEQGRQVYDGNCVGCHGVDGEGPAAKLAGVKTLQRKGSVIPQIIAGGHFMPAFGNLTDAQVAAVASYVRESFGNDFGIIEESDVADYR